MSRTPLEEFYLIEVVTGIFPTSEVVVRIHAGGGRPRDKLVSPPMLQGESKKSGISKTFKLL